jgi:hypothetical protein
MGLVRLEHGSQESIGLCHMAQHWIGWFGSRAVGVEEAGEGDAIPTVDDVVGLEGSGAEGGFGEG